LPSSDCSVADIKRLLDVQQALRNKPYRRSDIVYLSS